MIEPLTDNQRDAINHYNAYNVPVQWFVGSERDDGSREFIALGDGFAWSLLVEEDGTVHTSEAEVGDFETGIEI